MRRTLLAFFGLAFVIYWMSTADLRPRDPREQLDPVIPSLVRVGAQWPSKVELFVRKHLTNDGEMRAWLKSESARVGHVDADQGTTRKRLKERALLLKSDELNWLKKTAVEKQASGDERFLAVYMIGLSDSTLALDLLKEIGLSQIAAPANDRAYSDEVIIRAQALDSLVHRLSAVDAIRYLRDLLAKTSDPAIARHAQYWLSHLG
jgi:hypothetical protein